jgi:hypothetical protein
MIGAPVGVDDQIGGQVKPCRFDEDMHPRRRSATANGIADDPADGVTRRDRPRPDELFPFLQGDVRNLAGRGIDLIQRAIGPRILLDGVEEAVAYWLHAGCGVRCANALARIGWLRRAGRIRHRLQLAWKRQWHRDRQNFNRARRLSATTSVEGFNS